MVIPLPCGFLWPLRFFKRISGEINKQKKNPFFFFSISYFHFLGGMETPWHLMTLSGYIPLGRFHPSGTKREPGESDQPDKKKRIKTAGNPGNFLCVYIYIKEEGALLLLVAPATHRQQLLMMVNTICVVGCCSSAPESRIETAALMSCRAHIQFCRKRRRRPCISDQLPWPRPNKKKRPGVPGPPNVSGPIGPSHVALMTR